MVSFEHRPVLRDEVVRYLAPERGGVYLDGTLGGGGHAAAILAAGAEAVLLGIDRDAEAVEAAAARLRESGPDERVRVARGDYADAKQLFDLGEGTLAGVLLDLGVSSHQIDSDERGFSFRPGVPLDMRMSPETTDRTAADLLKDLAQPELVDLFREYGEVPRAGRLADAIVRRRRADSLETSDDLVAAVEAAYGRPASASDCAPVFQALRIAVNGELDSLDRGLPSLRDLLAPGGRMVVISYHSLEDRRVKRAFRDWSRECVCPPGLPVCRCRGRPLGRAITRGAVGPSAEEVAENPRARSARLRAWERGE